MVCDPTFLYVFMNGHNETRRGFYWSRIKTAGKSLSKKMWTVCRRVGLIWEADMNLFVLHASNGEITSASESRRRLQQQLIFISFPMKSCETRGRIQSRTETMQREEAEGRQDVTTATTESCYCDHITASEQQSELMHPIIHRSLLHLTCAGVESSWKWYWLDVANIHVEYIL